MMELCLVVASAAAAVASVKDELIVLANDEPVVAVKVESSVKR